MHSFLTYPNRFLHFLTQRPTVSFIILIALLFSVILLGYRLRTPSAIDETKTTATKVTTVYELGTDTAYLSVPALTRKESVMTVVALTSGVVNAITVVPGQSVGSGRVLLTLTGDYNSGAADIQKEIAINSDQLQQNLFSLEKRINELERKKVKQDDTLSDLGETLELKKLKLAREQLKADLKNSSLSVKLTLANDAILKPRSYGAGTVERVFVRRGDHVTPGTPLVSIRSQGGTTTLEALISPETARQFDPEKETWLVLSPDERLPLIPTYFSRQETVNGLHSILFTLSDAIRERVTNGQYETLELPLSPLEPTSFLVPLDALFQDSERAWVMTAEEGRAVLHEVTLGSVTGNFALITSGLTREMKLVHNRNILPGESITVTE